jgi:hypothetical protein
MKTNFNNTDVFTSKWNVNIINLSYLKLCTNVSQIHVYRVLLFSQVSHNEDLHLLYFLQNIMKRFKLRSIGHVARMRVVKHAY